MVSSRAFAVNVLSHGQAHLAARFAGMDGSRREVRFAGSPDWTVLATGAPVLADAAASFDCTVVQDVELSSHTLLVGLVQAIRTEPTTTPLLYMDGGWASLVRANKLDFEAYAEVVERLGLVIDRLVAAKADPQASLMEFVQEFATVTAAQSGVLQDFYAHETFAPSDRLDAINRRKRDVETKLARLLDKGTEAGVFDIPDAAITADAILGMLTSIHRWPDRRAMPDAGTIGPAFASLTAAMVRARAG